MDILKSFELFWSLPEKLFGKKFFRVCHIETTVSPSKEEILETSIEADTSSSDENITLNVYNNQKVYSLLAGVLYKKKMMQSNENQNSKIYNLSAIS